MARNRERLQSKKDQIKKLKQQVAELEEQEIKRLGGLAFEAGLGDLNVDDDTLLQEFQTIAGKKFRNPRPERVTPVNAETDSTQATTSGESNDGAQAGHAA